MNYQIYTFKKKFQPQLLNENQQLIRVGLDLYQEVMDHMRRNGSNMDWNVENINILMLNNQDAKNKFLEILKKGVLELNQSFSIEEKEYFSYEVIDFEFIEINTRTASETRIELTVESLPITFLKQIGDKYLVVAGDKSTEIKEGTDLNEIFVIDFPINDVDTFRSIAV